MGNKIQAGFDLAGKVFGKRLADVGMYFVLEILSTIAVLLPLVGYLGANFLTSSSNFNSMFDGNGIQSALRGDISGKLVNPSVVGQLLGIVFLVLVIAIVVQSFVQGVGISIAKHANEDSTEGFGSTIALAYSKWGRLIGLMVLSILLIVAMAFGFIMAVSILAMMFIGAGNAGAYLGLVLIIPLIIVFCYFIFPLFYIGPIDALMSNRPVSEIIGNALTKSVKVRWPVFILALCVASIQFILNILLSLLHLSFLTNILMIPVALISWCILLPHYQEYSKDCIPKPILLQIASDAETKPGEDEHPDNNDINPNL